MRRRRNYSFEQHLSRLADSHASRTVRNKKSPPWAQLLASLFLFARILIRIVRGK